MFSWLKCDVRNYDYWSCAWSNEWEYSFVHGFHDGQVVLFRSQRKMVERKNQVTLPDTMLSWLNWLRGVSKCAGVSWRWCELRRLIGVKGLLSGTQAKESNQWNTLIWCLNAKSVLVEKKIGEVLAKVSTGNKSTGYSLLDKKVPEKAQTPSGNSAASNT